MASAVTAIPCPRCGSSQCTVIDTRASENAIRRRRRCLRCAFAYTSYEYLAADRIAAVGRAGRLSIRLRNAGQAALAAADALEQLVSEDGKDGA